MGNEQVEGSTSMKWKAFFAAIEHEHRELVVTMLQEYDIGGYIVSFETAEGVHLETNGQHMHFCVQINDKDYHSFSERLKRKFKLRGRAVKGLPAQFKCLTKIENLEKMMSYTLKDGVYDSNMSEAQLKGLYEQSYKKQEQKTQYQKMIEHLGKVKMVKEPGYGHTGPYTTYVGELRRAVIEFHIIENTGKGITRGTVESAARKYIMYHSDLDNEEKTNVIMDEFFFFHNNIG